MLPRPIERPFARQFEVGNEMELNELMNDFRLASREIFNHYFRIHPAYDNAGWQSLERFKELEVVLFRQLVTGPIGIDSTPAYGSPQPRIRVALADGLRDAPILVNREIDSGYWDHPISRIDGGTELVFLAFFDFDQLGIRDNKFVRVIIDSSGEMELTGKHALLDASYVKYEIR